MLNTEIRPITETVPFNTMRLMVAKIWHVCIWGQKSSYNPIYSVKYSSLATYSLGILPIDFTNAKGFTNYSIFVFFTILIVYKVQCSILFTCGETPYLQCGWYFLASLQFLV